MIQLRLLSELLQKFSKQYFEYVPIKSLREPNLTL